MILILGGTTEGRIAVATVAEAARPYFYATRGAQQRIELPHGKRLTGALDAPAMEAFCRSHGIRLLIDAGHPFAEELHRTVAAVARTLGIPALRLERQFPAAEADDPTLIRCTGYADAMQQLERSGIRRLLALTGVQTIARLRPYWSRHPHTLFRILDRPESRELAAAQGFPAERLLFFREEDDELELLKRLRPDAVLTKESGESGYFSRKAAAAREAGIPLFVVERPPLPPALEPVANGEALRRRIEELLPGYYPLRSGYTTGTCATAAACAALELLRSGRLPRHVTVTLPCGIEARLPVEQGDSGEGWAWASVRKEAGDDPDATNHCLITTRIVPNPSGEVRFLRGEGVGRVTLPGLGIPVGEPAVNATPRRMIREAIAASGLCGADVTISVAGGEELAARTFNPKLGIVGGISIIGTSGIVRPFSNEAFVASIRKEIEVARAVGCERLVINSGAKSESYVRREFPGLPPQAFVHYGNFIGQTLAAAADCGFREVTMGIMLGKAVKLAEGHLDTHSRKVVMNREFLAALAARSGCTEAAAEAIGRMTLARELWERLAPDDLDRLMPALLAECRRHCAPLLRGGRLSLLLISEEGRIACRTEE